ncbi:S8 family peptidase [Natrinema ejinorense]|uniref:Peptidase S8/S53 domain-containing protein n=1 Tax=Natrinema ejinorense TaxID=373386 RepID=A0A2A5QPH2_9EURY|nr:S8 family serine peptidase [Natrinema ejinorense]PCR88685.1 hypothetical protein CP557_21900 [Natrinema ejinorense]
MRRRELLRSTAGVGALALSFPSFRVGGSDTATPAAFDADAITSGSTPTWLVKYDTDRKGSLTEWLDGHEDRIQRRDLDGLDMMVIEAPRSEIGLGQLDLLLGNGLQSRSYVKWIDVNLRMQYADPITSLESDDVWEHDLSAWQSFRVGSSTGSLADAGVAFDEDTEETTMADAKWLTNSETIIDDGSGLTVAIIDSGCNTGGGIFEDADGNTRILDASEDFVAGETVAEDGLDAVADPNGHGTWVASAIAANPPDSADVEHMGYLPGADLLICRALDSKGSGSTEAIAAAIDHAAANGADLLCMSLGSVTWSAALDDALASAKDQGMAAFVAAGNDRFGSTWVNSPADSEHALAVGATNVAVDDRQNVKPAYFHNVGDDPGTTDLSGGESAGAMVDITAPGMAMTTLTPRTTGSVIERTLSGTSMATPCVVGCAGLVLASNPDLEPDELHDRLTTYARPVENVAVVEAEHGLVDAQAAIEKTEREDTQGDVMNDEATSRDAAYRALSSASGGFFTGLF